MFLDEPEIIESDDDGADEEEFKDNGEYFVLRTFEEVKKLIEDYCDRTSSHFVVQKKTKTFGANCKLNTIHGLLLLMLLLIILL